MADNDIETLMNAREALAGKRLTWAQTIASPGEIPEAAIRAIIEVQHAIDVIDRMIEELEEAHEVEAEEEEEEERKRRNKEPVGVTGGR
jgi:acyl-CoA reductase-like NAD-dependent aldehyde dehydrogenase